MNEVRTKVIGVIGGIASGKSAAADILQTWGADRFDADQAGHEALEQSAVRSQLVKRFGEHVLDEQGRVVRSEIAQRVFQETEQGRDDLQFLNSVTHPWIRASFERYAAHSKAAVLLVDAALLLEANWDSFCDVILFVDASDEVRRSRATERGWTLEHWESREASQVSLSEKRKKATNIVPNNGTLEDLANQLTPLAVEWGLSPS